MFPVTTRPVDSRDLLGGAGCLVHGQTRMSPNPARLAWSPRGTTRYSPFEPAYRLLRFDSDVPKSWSGPAFMEVFISRKRLVRRVAARENVGRQDSLLRTPPSRARPVGTTRRMGNG